jgi:ketosteroid isomerase-like protein
MTSGDKPAIAQILALNERLETAAQTGDVEVLKDLLSRELVVSDPGNKIRRREDLLALFDRGEVAYRSIETTIDFVDELRDLVVIMGTESTILESAPQGSPWGPGTTLRRRFTNVFRNEDGSWRLIIKQSTVFAVE